MNFDRLQTFRLVVQLGSFSRAAEELFLSQPAVSLQIRHLEKELGVVLLERLSLIHISEPTRTY